jgi:hypothetical protein
MGLRDLLRAPKTHRQTRSETRGAGEISSEPIESPSSLARLHFTPSSSTPGAQEHKGIVGTSIPGDPSNIPLSRNADRSISNRFRFAFNYDGDNGGSKTAGVIIGEYERSLRVHVESVSSTMVDDKSALTCQSGTTSSRQARIARKSGRASRFSSQQRWRSSHNSSTRPSFAAVSCWYGRTPCSMASLILSVSHPSYGTRPHSTYRYSERS